MVVTNRHGQRALALVQTAAWEGKWRYTIAVHNGVDFTDEASEDEDELRPLRNDKEGKALLKSLATYNLLQVPANNGTDFRTAS